MRGPPDLCATGTIPAAYVTDNKWAKEFNRQIKIVFLYLAYHILYHPDTEVFIPHRV